MTAVIVQASLGSKIGYQAFGAAREFWRYKGPEAILAGPYETGKTLAALHKLNALAVKYPGSRGLMVRKTYKSLIGSVVVTFERKVLAYPPDHPRCPIERYGGEKPEWYDYPNGSRITLGGMDNADKFLSAEYDFIYVNQAEELSIDDWEKLTGRATGRAENAPYAQSFGDCNPSHQFHWILQRPRLKVFESRHEDNPTLYDQTTGVLTERGKKTMETLDALTGVRYKRGRLGLWVAAEGQVYEYDPAIHLVDRFEVPKLWRRFRSIDLGYRNPFVCQWWALNDDNQLFLYRELYMTERTVKVHAEQIKRYSAGETYEATISDHDASDRATLEENGIKTIAAQKDVQVGIEKVQERLKVRGDGKPGLYLLRDSVIERDEKRRETFRSTCTEEEFAGYIYPEAKEGKSEDEKPVKVDDHGMDAMRYMVMHLDGVIYAPPRVVPYA
jgi:phage terminase large subunit